MKRRDGSTMPRKGFDRRNRCIVDWAESISHLDSPFNMRARIARRKKREANRIHKENAAAVASSKGDK